MSRIVDHLQDWAQIAADRICDWSTHPEGGGPKPKIIAHRGAWGDSNPENTMSTLKKAADLGAWGIEFDVHFTKDGVPVVNHDPDLRRIHGADGRIRELTWGELKTRAPAIPKLEEILTIPAHFMIEIKTLMSSDEQKTFQNLLARFKPKTDYHILTLREEFFRDHSAHPPEAWIFVTDLKMRNAFRQVKVHHFGGIACHYLALTRDMIRRLHDEFLVAGSGFAPTKNLYRREWCRGVDWVFTNRIADLV